MFIKKSNRGEQKENDMSGIMNNNDSEKVIVQLLKELNGFGQLKNDFLWHEDQIAKIKGVVKNLIASIDQMYKERELNVKVYGVRDMLVQLYLHLDSMSKKPSLKPSEELEWIAQVNNLLSKIKKELQTIAWSIKGSAEKKRGLSIEPMSKQTLQQAIALANTAFPSQRMFDKASDSFKISIAREKGGLSALVAKTIWKVVGVNDVRYWVACLDGKVIGLTGLFFYVKDEGEAVWISWTAVDERFQNKLSLVGGLLLKKVFQEALKTGKKYIRMETTSEPAHRVALALYLKYGFQITKRILDKSKKFEWLYLQKQIHI